MADERRIAVLLVLSVLLLQCQWWLIQECMSADMIPLDGMDHGFDVLVLSSEELTRGQTWSSVDRSSVLDGIILSST